jgi:exodeoxyribonuclease X
MLRYQRRPQGLIREIGLPAHRAMPDAYVTAHHLRDLLNESSLDQLIAWSLEPGLLPRVRNGAHKGKAWDQLTDEALADLAKDRDVDVRFSATTEQRIREVEPERVEQASSQPRLL